MPELPEVEKARREFAGRCVPGQIINAQLFEDDIVFAQRINNSSLVDRRVKSIDRRGKWLIINLTDNQSLLVHFGMTGRLEYYPALKPLSNYKSHKRSTDDTQLWPPKYCKFLLHIRPDTPAPLKEFSSSNNNNGDDYGSDNDSIVQVAFTDPRRLGRVHLLPTTQTHSQPPLSDLAPDALLSLPAPDQFYSSLQKTSRPIKSLLLDQTLSGGVVCGIGNWLADEILYQTQLHPESACSALSPVIVNQLRESIHRILEIACDVDSDLDQMPADWLVHYRWSKRAKTTVRTADGHPIKFITVGGRTSAVCLSRQRLIRSSIAGIGSRKQSQEDEKRLTDNQPQVFEKRKVDKVPSARQKSERIAAVVAKRKEIP